MPTKSVSILNLKWVKQMFLLLILAPFVGCSASKSRTTFSSSDPEKIAAHRSNEIRKKREICIDHIDNLEAREQKKNLEYALLLHKADSFSNRLEVILKSIYGVYLQPGDPDEFPQTQVESMYDSLRVFENFTHQSLCPTEGPQNFFYLDSTKVHEQLNIREVRVMLLSIMQQTVYRMLAENLKCKRNN